MPFPRLQWGQWCLIACAAMVLLIPAGLAALAPALAPLPASASLPRWDAPPFPDRETPLPGFQDLLDPLPLVVRDLPEDASQEVVAAYDRATLFDPQPSRDMLVAAERAIPVPKGLNGVWHDWVRDFTSDSGDFAPIPDAILDALRDDPRNADRLNNLAVARYFTVLTEKGDGAVRGVVSDPRAKSAMQLLGATSQAFPDSRAPVLNYAFLSPSAVLSAWSIAHPEDVTALQLLVSQHTRGSEPAPETLVAQLHLLSQAPDALLSALGHALLGDLDLKLARDQREKSPFTSQQTARQALHEYDAALTLSDDPSIYAARAATLELLGNIQAAIETQERAVQLQPDSVPLILRLGDLYRDQRGDEHEIRDGMQQAREQYRTAFTYAVDQLTSPLSNVQIQVDHYQMSFPGESMRVSEYTAFRPARTYVSLLSCVGCAGGGFILSTYDLIPESTPVPEVASPWLPAERAAYSSAIASVVLGDPLGVAVDTAKLQELIGDPRWPRSDVGEHALVTLSETIVPAAQLVADLSSPSDATSSAVLYFAVQALSSAGLHRNAATLCRNVFDRPDAAYRESSWRCLGTEAYLAGEYGVARQAFADSGDPLYEGFVAQMTGDLDEAKSLYKSVLINVSDVQGELRGSVERIATVRLGDVYLESGDALGAIELYDKAIARHEQFEIEPGSVERSELQHARNNRGIARLQVQMDPESAPDCSGKAATVCADALADFEMALRSDPYNPVYLLGKAWVERSLGNPEAAIQTLNEAVQVDPGLFPALNDIGVLAAQSGDFPRARQMFTDALAVNPDYDLALWNLGVLEMQRGVRGVPRGQAYLARAILENPSFATSGLSYRMDEQIYRVEFNERVQRGAGWSFASATSVATAVVGLIAVISIILRATDLFLKDKIQSTLMTGAVDAAKRVEQKVGRRFSLPAGDGWGLWLPLLVTISALAFVTSWTARSEGSGAAAVWLALFATLTAVLVHELGHALVAWKLKAHLQPAQWGLGAVLALLLLPAQMNAGPFPGQRVVAKDENVAWRVLLGGPLANLLVALGAYTLFYFQPLPGLRAIALVQLAAVSYALLPFEPLDGVALSRSRPLMVGALATLVSIAGLLSKLGVF